jgi:hypothetical protein
MPNFVPHGLVQAVRPRVCILEISGLNLHMDTRYPNRATFLVFKCYVVSTVHFGMKLYNDQRNAQVFNLFIYLLLSYMFRAFF